MLSFRDVRLASLTAIATLALGCPSPTGRMRGEIDASCDTVGSITAGAPCTVSNQFCSLEATCNGDGVQNLDCTCLSGFWSCFPSECQTPFRDATAPVCPSGTIHHGDRCTAMQGGLYCNGRLTCGGSDVFAMCWCTGSSWACTAPGCFDAGSDAAQDVSDASSEVLPCAPDFATAMCTFGDRCRNEVTPACSRLCTCQVDDLFECGPLTCEMDASTD
jgi:hypothetical protein